MKQIEIETTYLATKLPDGLDPLQSRILADTYFPAGSVHPSLRIRQKGSSYMLTKKTKLDAADASTQQEENIALTQEEFAALNAGNGKRVSKIRYEVPVGEYTAEVDIFTGDLAGLVLVDVEFPSKEARDNFIKPDFCGGDVTQEDFIAGGMLAGKRYADIADELARWDYQSIDVSHLIDTH